VISHEGDSESDHESGSASESKSDHESDNWETRVAEIAKAGGSKQSW
jgi:hypothetical protein